MRHLWEQLLHQANKDSALSQISHDTPGRILKDLLDGSQEPPGTFLIFLGGQIKVKGIVCFDIDGDEDSSFLAEDRHRLTIDLKDPSPFWSELFGDL